MGLVRSPFFLSLLLVSALAFSFPARAEKTKITTAGNGLPDVAAQLGPDAFVPMETKRLTGARILWVNWALLEEMGIQVPAGGLTPKFEEQLLKTFAYAIPQPTDPASAFTEQTKPFYADRYGGTGMGASQGSGRAASAGQFQIKGIGRTPLAEEVHRKSIFNIVNFLGAYGHQHGGLPFKEAIPEAIWGDVLNTELPHGANRVAFVLSTGTSTQWLGPFKEPRALIVRENSIRPAHLMSNWQLQQSKETDDKDYDRRAKQAKNLLAMLPVAPEETEGRNLNDGQILRFRLLEMTKRWGRQFGSQYAKSLLHSSITPSNVQIDGKMLDYGTMTALDGYPRAKVGRGINGELGHLEDDVVRAFLQDVRELLSPDLRTHVPSYAEAGKALRKGFHGQKDLEFLWLAGVPPELAKDLAKTPAGKVLSGRIQEIARAGNDTLYDLTYGIYRNTGTYDLERILNALVGTDGKDAAALQTRLVKAGLSPELAGRLAKEYFSFLPLLKQAAAHHGVSESGLAGYQTHAVALRNRKLEGLYRGMGFLNRVKGKIREFSSSGDPTVIRDFIETTIHDNQRTFTDTDPFTVVLEEMNLPNNEARVRRVYDGRTGEIRVTIDAKVSGAQVAGAVAVRFDDESPLTGEVLSVKKGRARIAVPDRSLNGLDVELRVSGRKKLELSIPEDPRGPNLLQRCWKGFTLLLPGPH